MPRILTFLLFIFSKYLKPRSEKNGHTIICKEKCISDPNVH